MLCRGGGGSVVSSKFSSRAGGDFGAKTGVYSVSNRSGWPFEGCCGLSREEGVMGVSGVVRGGFRAICGEGTCFDTLP